MTLKLSRTIPPQMAREPRYTSRVLTTGMGPPAPQNAGGGDLNGTQATSILHSQSGTSAAKIAVPRKFANAGNWCGTV